MRRRLVLRPAMARLGNKHIIGCSKIRYWILLPIFCAFLVTVSGALWFFLILYPKNSEEPVVVVGMPVGLLSSHTSLPPPSPPPAPPSPLRTPPPRSPPPRPRQQQPRRSIVKEDDRCAGRYIFVHDLPPEFNIEMLQHCRTLSRWTDMCRYTSNAGLGPKLEKNGNVFSGRGWYATNQFALDVIFHNRMRQYECLTTNSSLAAAIFVPYYAGLDIARYLWAPNTAAVRDATPRELFRWLRSKPEWGAMSGQDHFMVAGRITWDFQRPTDHDDDWGNKLMLLPEAQNLTVLVIESSPWKRNDVGVPYPTYFHPSTDSEVRAWQEKMRRARRPWLFTFAGGARPGETAWIRNEAMEQCRQSRQCKLLECNIGYSKCHSPDSVMRMFERSVFCLQPQGDSFTRRSMFDAMVAGCVPVFFHPGSAYVQYLWHLPRNYNRYSVFIPEDKVREGNVRIEEALKKIKKKVVRAMREEVIRMIPRLVYADPRARPPGVRDAFDVAIAGVIERVRDIRRRKATVVFKERETWKYALVGREKEIAGWERFFRKGRN
ncbi:hypothetical protein ZIOFF_001596 [Zingiber officinale]|uniref:Exostosin GT47 domain-containing protein n=2 Tax=Zingiber officinale TaxID=94328 RepID=A0A8J5LV52_ZINOF|nr:hypothetical protein ZIOFF_001596 [Zingiber officinale]